MYTTLDEKFTSQEFRKSPKVQIDTEYKVDFVDKWSLDYKAIIVAGSYNLNPSYPSFFRRSLKQPYFIPMMELNPDNQVKVKATISCFKLNGFYF
ncbi:hypothetical protein BpHYR1_035974 [Brachionus plicatilis]|uniref:Uncharacterized protein n=1 Tax=Brachionus plicatilis TaxID=10195 RepID=A0A3M7P499_BRAPC|nr:hypothetical protein BpHYR1_035974 [Brachionus plicatilis]